MTTDTRFSRLLGHLLETAPPLRPWGFVLYRCTYADDGVWRRFLAVLRRRARDELRDELARSRRPRTLRRRVQGGRVRPLLRLGRGHGNDDDDPRYRYAVYVDADTLASVLDRAPPPLPPNTGGAGYVVLIDSQAEAWDDDGGGSLDDGDGSLDDEGEEPPVEGCTLYDVGWMKVPADGLVPSVYAAALQPEWFQSVYMRPPAVFWAL